MFLLMKAVCHEVHSFLDANIFSLPHETFFSKSNSEFSGVIKERRNYMDLVLTMGIASLKSE